MWHAASPSVRYYEGMEHGDQANVSDNHDPEEVVVEFLNFDIDACGKFLLKILLRIQYLEKATKLVWEGLL